MQDTENIYFHVEDVEFVLEDQNNYVVWLNEIARLSGNTLSEINYIFCSDEYLLNINREYLKHDYFTDIISFPYAEVPQPIEGDIFISIDSVRDNAVDHKTDFQSELLRVMAHGLLHFMGFRDKTNEEQQLMRVKEEECMALFFQLSTK